MNKLDIICFTSACRTKNFSITAKELMISQQAVSKHIRRLEEEIGYPLFFRSAGTVELTQAGRFMQEYFHARSEVLDDIKQYLQTKQSVTLNVACSQWLGCPDSFRNALRSFQKDYPGIHFHLYNLPAEETAEGIQKGKLDCLLTSRYSAQYLPSFWNWVPVFQLPLYIIRSSQVPFNKEQLSQHPFFASKAGETSERAVLPRVRNICRRIGFTPGDIRVQADMGSVMLNILLAGGITLGTYILQDDAQEFSFDPTDELVDVVLATPFQQSGQYAQTLTEYLLDRIRVEHQAAHLPKKKGGTHQ